MALSDLTLSVSACITGADCDTLTVSDTTGQYNLSDNQGGWDNSSTVFISKIINAKLTIIPANGDSFEVDVTSQLPSSVTGTFSFDNISLPTAGDGEYTVKYTVTESTGRTKTVEIKIFSLCSVRQCIDKLWSNFANEVADNSDCNCAQTSSMTYKDKAMMGEALYKALQAAIRCNASVADRNKILTKLQRLCSLEDCNCD